MRRRPLLIVLAEELPELLTLDIRGVLDRERAALRDDLRGGVGALDAREAGTLREQEGFFRVRLEVKATAREREEKGRKTHLPPLLDFAYFTIINFTLLRHDKLLLEMKLQVRTRRKGDKSISAAFM